MAPETRASQIAKDWEHHHYYEQAEDWLAGFWERGSHFRNMFDKLDIRRVAELACGHGRHAAQIIEMTEIIYLVDVGKPNIDACKRRFWGRDNVRFILNDGAALAGIPDGSLTSLFSYDAMVHFEADTILSYLSEIARVLEPNGRALLHYSNFDALPATEYGHGPHMRNYFSERMMTHFAHRRGLNRVDSRLIDWGHDPSYYGLDALTLLQKAG